MRIHLGGHLGWYDGEKRDWLTIEQPDPISLPALAARLGVPPEEVAIIAVNRRLAHWDDPPVRDGDVVEFFPPMGGGAEHGAPMGGGAEHGAPMGGS